jgi:hypothetical protein
MARPVVSQAAEDLYSLLTPLAYDDERYDWPLLTFCESLIGHLQTVLDLSSDGYSHLLDIDTIPYIAIPWLGQFVGITTPPIQPGETAAAHEARIRDIVRNPQYGGFGRGTPSSMVQAAQQWLTGDKTVILRERWGSAYRVSIRTKASETPDSAKVLKALTAQKPAGIVLDYAVMVGPEWQDVITTYATWQQVFTGNTDWQDLLEG